MPQGEFAYWDREKLQRSLKEAAGELEARLAANTERRFPVMGLRGAAGGLMLREMRSRLTRPIVAVTSTASEAEALAGEAAFFLDEAADADAATRRVHLLRSWEVKPMAQLSPPTDAQASQLAALFAMLRHQSPLIVTSAEAMMTRTMPRASFDDSIVTVAIGGQARSRRPGRGARRHAAISACRRPRRPAISACAAASSMSFSPLYRDPIRIELEDDVVTSIRHFDADSQRSVGELVEATIIRTRYVPPSILRTRKLRERVALRCAEIGMVRKEAAELSETLENGLLFPGVELLMPYAYGRALDIVFDYMPADALLWMIDPGRILAEAERFADTGQQRNGGGAREARPFIPRRSRCFSAPTNSIARSQRSPPSRSVRWSRMPRRAKAGRLRSKSKSQPSLRLGATELTGT